MRASHLDAERRYNLIRKESLIATERIVQRIHPQLRLTTLNTHVLKATETWKYNFKRKVDWDWLGSYNDIRFRYPKRFEAAVWYKNKLNGLSIGRPTYTGDSLRLDFIERSPGNCDVAIFDIIVVAMRTYADMIDARELRIMNPVNDQVKRYYESYGFCYVKKDDYLFLRI